MDDSDRNLIQAHLSGQPAAFETILRRYGPGVLGYLTKMTKHPQQAEDYFQETFRKVHLKANTFTGENLRPWIFTIATNTALSGMKKESKYKAVSIHNSASCEDGQHCPAMQIADPAEKTDPAKQVELEETKNQVRQVLLSLPEKQRTAVILSYYHKMSYKDIAESLNCSIGAVKTSIFRSLKKLAVKLPHLSTRP